MGPEIMCQCTSGDKQMSQSDLMKYGIAAGILFAAYKYGNAMTKGAAIAVGSMIVAKRVPYLNAVL
jgi:hypothetical protein